MIKHIVMWKLKDSFSNDEKREIAKKIKADLEALRTLMDGVLKVDVEIEALSSSNVDVMLVSEFVSEEVLQAYQVHPKHQEVGAYIKEKVMSRSCMDYLN